MISQSLPPSSFIFKDSNGKAYQCARIRHHHGDYIRQVVTVIGVEKMADNALYGYDNESLSAMVKRSKLLAANIISNAVFHCAVAA